MEHSAFNAQGIDQAEPETVVVHVQLRPRRGMRPDAVRFEPRENVSAIFQYR